MVTRPYINMPSFTTHKKTRKTTIDISRKGSIVKERCRQLTDMIINLWPSRVLSDEDLVCLIEDYIGTDKETVRNYKGYGGNVRVGRCGDNKIVGYSRKGYLERFGFLRKIPGRRWAVCQSVLSSQGSVKSCGGVGSKEKIFISPSQSCGERVGGETALEVAPNSSNELEEEEGTEKDRFFTPMISPMIRASEDKARNLSPMISPKISTENSGDDPTLKWLQLIAKAKPKEEADKGMLVS